MEAVMTNEQILKKAIEKAVKNGYVTIIPGFPFKNYPCFSNKENEEFAIIFEHEFAKAFFPDTSYGYGYCKKCNEKLGETEVGGWMCGECDKVCSESIESWQFHLQQMVLEPEPLKYLERFLDANPDK